MGTDEPMERRGKKPGWFYTRKEPRRVGAVARQTSRFDEYNELEELEKTRTVSYVIVMKMLLQPERGRNRVGDLYQPATSQRGMHLSIALDPKRDWTGVDF